MFTQIADFVVGTVGDWWYTGIFIMMIIESSCIIPFPSEVAMIPAGYLVQQGEMNLFLVFFWGTLWAMIGSVFNYYLGKKLGGPITKALIKKWGKYVFLNLKHYEKVEVFFQRHGSIATFTGRLIIGIRQLISLPAGVFRMHFGKFLTYTFLWAGIWNGILIAIGYIAGENRELIAMYSSQVLIGGILSVVCIGGIYFLFQKRKNIMQSFTGKKIAILWFGREGISTLAFLRKNEIPDINITILDEKQVQVENFWWHIFTGKKVFSRLWEYDIIFKSPGISSFLPEIRKNADKITSQTKFFYENYRGKIISVTQTKGKSTTATLTYELLKNAGYHVLLAGNIGKPILDEIDFQNPYDFIVYELSSYMLHDLWDSHKSFISVLGNIYNDHIDRHENFENYMNAKKSILRNAQNILLGIPVIQYIDLEKYDNIRIFWGGEKCDISHNEKAFCIDGRNIPASPKLIGKHNWDNMCGVLWVAQILGIPEEIFQKTVENLAPLAHRMQNIGIFQGITFIDDAISTTPESTIAALETFPDVETIFLGGSDRGYDFSELCEKIDISNIKNIVFFPENGEVIQKGLTKKYHILETDDMQKAVEFAFRYTKKEKICLLSTASPSYSVWKNFEEKGNLFQKYVKEYTK